jgi:hypothetical protein
MIYNRKYNRIGTEQGEPFRATLPTSRTTTISSRRNRIPLTNVRWLCMKSLSKQWFLFRDRRHQLENDVKLRDILLTYGNLCSVIK